MLEIEPRGSETLRASGVLPIGQSTTPYQIYDAFFDVTKAAAGWDIDTVKQSLNVLSETVDQTYPHLSAALDGVARFSDTIGKRDEQFKELLANANKIASVLGDRSGQINELLLNSRTLLAAINDRGSTVDYLLENVSQVSRQFEGLIADNPNLNRVLEQLQTVSGILERHKFDLADSLSTLSKFTASLAEAIGSGPYFKVVIINLLPGQASNRSSTPRSRSVASIPNSSGATRACRPSSSPIRTVQRQPNGAPPPAPRVLEGTPDYPGPAVPPGSPCSYTPPADGIPTPGNPLPCASLSDRPLRRQPVRTELRPAPGCPDLAHRTRTPRRRRPVCRSRREPRSSRSRSCRVVPVPIGEGPPGARTLPLGPLPDRPPPVPAPPYRRLRHRLRVRASSCRRIPLRRCRVTHPSSSRRSRQKTREVTDRCPRSSMSAT